MKLIVISKSIPIKNENTTTDEVHLFSQFFIHKNNIRNREIQICLETNISNEFVTKIHLLNERFYSQKEMGIVNNFDKIIQIVIGHRLCYKDVFEYIRYNLIKGYLILSNIDIFFDSTIKKLHSSTLNEKTIQNKKQMIALLRYEYNGISTNSSLLFGPRFDSQDVWIFHSTNSIEENQEKAFSFEFGKPGCDNKIIYLMKILGYEIYNDPLYIKSYHYHSILSRDYTYKDTISLPWGVIIPAKLINYNYLPSLGINLQARNQLISFDDNDVLREYISNKIDKNEKFILPRISGIENNVAVLLEKLFSNDTSLQKEVNTSYLNQIIPIMKTNAGIKLSSYNSANKYSQLYMQAFNDCELFCGWEIQGNYIHHISESHDYMIKKYKDKKMIWSISLDIFHYIYLNPWTTSLQGKRILIISSFIDSISENIRDRDKIYNNIDLFPECSFVFIKPPITNASENSREFDIELQEFTKHLDVIKDDYDIALLACGGYANPICSYIYNNHNKSAIYVGGVLQMYFGILGNRWIQERPDILNLYWNEYWKRPKITERPLHFQQVEKGCYW